MKVSIIGVNGYLGQNLAFLLKSKGFTVYGYARQNHSIVEIDFYDKIDVTDRLSCERINLDVDFLYCFFGVTGTSIAFKNYQNFIDVNEIGLLNILTVIVKSKFRPHIVFPSTRLIYKGQENISLSEESSKECKSIYALTKWFGEQILAQYQILFNIPYSIFRICVPYGNLANSNYSYGTIGFFLKMAQSGQDITLYGSGLLKRTISSVEDIGNQIILTLQNPLAVNKIFNIAGETYSLSMIADVISNKYNVSINHLPWPKLDLQLESGDTTFDFSKIIHLTDYKLKNSFEKWIQTL